LTVHHLTLRQAQDRLLILSPQVGCIITM
jgi:hypothetical protein